MDKLSEKNPVTPEVSLSLPGIETTYDFPENPTKKQEPKEAVPTEEPSSSATGNPLIISGKRAKSTIPLVDTTLYAPVSTFAKDAWSFEDELKKSLPPSDDNNQIQIKSPLCKLIRYPNYLKSAYSGPAGVIKKVHDKNLTIVQLIWKAPVSKTSKYLKLKRIKTDSSTNFTSKRTNTCIICHGISSFRHFFDDRGNSLFRYILEFESSNFNNVDMLQLPLVQSSMLRGKFSPYYQVNPLLLDMKGLEKVSNPTQNYSNVFTAKNWETSVRKCVIGPVEAEISKKEIEFEEKEDEKSFFRDEDEKSEEYEEYAST